MAEGWGLVLWGPKSNGGIVGVASVSAAQRSVCFVAVLWRMHNKQAPWQVYARVLHGASNVLVKLVRQKKALTS